MPDADRIADLCAPLCRFKRHDHRHQQAGSAGDAQSTTVALQYFSNFFAVYEQQ